MELAVFVLRAFARIMFVVVAALTATMSQYDDDMAEVGRPRWPAISLFAAIGAATALTSSLGFWFLTAPLIVAVTALAWPFKGRAFTLASVAIWGFLLQVASPAFGGQPFGWSLDDTVTAIVTPIALGALATIYLWQKRHDQLPDRPHAGEEVGGNPFVVPLAITIVVAVVLIVILAVIG